MTKSGIRAVVAFCSAGTCSCVKEAIGPGIYEDQGGEGMVTSFAEAAAKTLKSDPQGSALFTHCGSLCTGLLESYYQRTVPLCICTQDDVVVGRVYGLYVSLLW